MIIKNEKLSMSLLVFFCNISKAKIRLYFIPDTKIIPNSVKLVNLEF